MALIIKSTTKAQINYRSLDGTIQELPSVYARLEMALRPDGKNIEVAFPYLFLTKEAYKLNAPIIQTNLPQNHKGEVVEQSLQSAHELVKVYLEEIGYEIEINL